MVYRDWQHDEIRYLKISVNTKECSCKGKIKKHAGHVVTIKLPKEFYFCDVDLGKLEAPDGFRSYKYTKNDEKIYIRSTTTETLAINANSGTMKYYLDDEAEIKEATIYVAVKYDTVIWDHQEKSAITAAGVKPIDITLSSMDKYDINTATESAVSNISMSEAYAKDAMLIKNGTLWDSQQKDGSRRLQCFIYTQTGYGFGAYYKKGYVDITLPYYELDGKKYYLEYIDDNATNPVEATGLYGNNANKDIVYDRANGTITYSIEGMYYYNAYTAFATRLKVPDEIKSKTSSASLRFYYGTIKLTGESNAGGLVNLMNYYIGAADFQTVMKENVYFRGVTNRGVAPDLSRDGTLFMGGFYLENTGLADSEKKTYTFDFPEQLLITTLNMPTNRVDSTINVTYTLQDEEGKIIYFDKTTGEILPSGGANSTTKWTVGISNNTTSTKLDDANAQINRSKLQIESHKQYYFKTITYTVSMIQASALLYAIQSEGNLTGTGNYYGYLRGDVKAGDVYTSKCTLTSQNSSNYPVLVSERKTTVNANSSTSYDLWNLKVSAGSIVAGETFTISGNVGVSGYPYGNNQKIRGVKIGLILEEGMTFDKNEITLKVGTEVAQVDGVEVRKTDDGKNLWIINVKNDIAIGYNSESVGKLSTGDNIAFTIPIITDVNMPYTVMEMKKVILAAAEGDLTYATGTQATVDKYDINNNEVITDTIRYAGANNTQSWTIVDNPKKINISNSIKLNGVDVDRADSATIDDIITYSLHIKETNGAVTEKLEYYIPIFNKESVIDNRLIYSDGSNGFDMKLIGAVNIVGHYYFDVYYTTETGMTFIDAEELDSTKWYTADYIDEEELWSKVTMIKVVNANNQTIPGKFDTEIQVNLKANNAMNIIESGQVNEWGSRGYYKISVDGSAVGGYNGTKVVTAAVTYNEEVNENTDEVVKDSYSKESDDIVKADYDDTPSTSDNSNLIRWLILMCASAIGMICLTKMKYV